jgi:hypothetical protein
LLTRYSLSSFAFFLLFVLVGIGCDGGGPKLYSVEGKVLLDGQPAEGASVIFTPKAGASDGSSPPSGVVGADGTFKLETYPHGEGALPGDYKVVVTWYPPDARKQENPKNKAPAKYASAESTPLTATVKEESNTLEAFQLTK